MHSYPGLVHPRPGQRGWNCPGNFSGACTEVRLTQSSAGIPAGWDGALLSSRSLAAAAQRHMPPSPRG